MPTTWLRALAPPFTAFARLGSTHRLLAGGVEARPSDASTLPGAAGLLTRSARRQSKPSARLESRSGTRSSTDQALEVRPRRQPLRGAPVPSTHHAHPVAPSRTGQGHRSQPQRCSPSRPASIGCAPSGLQRHSLAAVRYRNGGLLRCSWTPGLRTCL